jgi:hypothetical protein
VVAPASVVSPPALVVGSLVGALVPLQSVVQVPPGSELGAGAGGSVGGVAGGTGGGSGGSGGGLCVPPPSPLGLVLGVVDGLRDGGGAFVDEVAALLDGVVVWSVHTDPVAPLFPHGSGPRSSDLTVLMHAQPMEGSKAPTRICTRCTSVTECEVATFARPAALRLPRTRSTAQFSTISSSARAIARACASSVAFRAER